MLVGQKTGNNKIEFLYDSNGDYYGFEYNDVKYYYVKNLQGDVIAIYNNSGSKVATYEYDAWGRLLSSTDTSGVSIGTINPIRYRSYYYDTETGFYYLNTRYYSPALCRFLSSDSLIDNRSVNTQNLFSYCANNPANNTDITGMMHVKGTDACGSAIGNQVACLLSDNVINNYFATVQKQIRRPNSGEPGSVFKLPNGDWRKFGADGRPEQDYDHDDHNLPNTHPHDENGGHYHDWDWSKDRPRQKPYVPEANILIGVGLAGVCTVGVVYVFVNDISVLGIADDFLFGPLCAGVVYGIKLTV